MRRGTWITVAATLGLATAAWALTGKNGWTATTVTTAAAIKANSTYVSGFAGARWQDLANFDMAVTSGPWDHLSADASGNVYVLVRGAATWNAGPQYYGLVKVGGSTITTLVQDHVESQVGTYLQRVVASPSDTGPLTKGHPVVLRVSGVYSGSTFTYDLVSVDPATGTETLVHRLSNWTRLHSMAIDGSGTATDGTIYLADVAAVTRLTYSGDAWVVDTVPGMTTSVTSVRVGPDGFLYTSSDGWGAIVPRGPNHPIYRVNPATGQSSVWGYVNGASFMKSWSFDAAGALWFGLSSTEQKYAKNPSYVTRGVAGGVTNINNRICEAGTTGTPFGVACGGGAVFVMEGFTAVYALRP